MKDITPDVVSIVAPAMPDPDSRIKEYDLQLPRPVTVTGYVAFDEVPRFDLAASLGAIKGAGRLLRRMSRLGARPLRKPRGLRRHIRRAKAAGTWRTR